MRLPRRQALKSDANLSYLKPLKCLEGYYILYYMERNTRTKPLSRSIKEARKAKGFTALELASKAGVTENAIRKLESGDSKEPRLSTALLIADALDLRSELIGDRTARIRRIAVPELASTIRQIRGCQHALAERGVKHLRIFGSVARGDAHPTSDVDVVIEPATTKFTLFDLAAARDILSDALRRRVDIITEETLRHASFRDTAEQEAVSAF